MKKLGILISLILAFSLSFSASANADGLICDVESAAHGATGNGSAMPIITLDSKFDDLGGIVIKGKTEQMNVVNSELNLPISAQKFAEYDGVSFGLKYLRTHEFSTKFTVIIKTPKGDFYQNNISSDSDDTVTLNFSSFKNYEGFSIKKSELLKATEISFNFYGINRAPAPINVGIAISDMYGVKDGVNYLPKKEEEEEKVEKEPKFDDEKITIPDYIEYIVGAVVFAGALVAVYFIFKKRKKAE